MSRSAGFTLIEMLLVISLIFILSSVAYLSTRDMQKNYTLKGAARDLLGQMQKTKLGAIRSGRTWAICLGNKTSSDPNDSAITFSTTFSAFSIRNKPGADNQLCTSDDPLAFDASTGLPLNYFYSTSDLNVFDLVSTDTKFEFNPTGSASSGNIQVLRKGLTSGQKLTVSSTTGNIRSEKLP